LGIPKAVQKDPVIPVGNCYIQNAAIAWKQPNGFYYPPTFHSRNLFFDNLDIRHYVIVPQFKPNEYLTDKDQAAKRYCAQNQNDAMFNGFSANDRQTFLTDDDGSLTGYALTSSVNEDKFFRAPIEGIECQSEGATPEGGTARTSPYDYVTIAVYPDDAQFAPPPPKEQPPNCSKMGPDPNWDSDCTNETCFGVPLYRLYQTKTEGKNPPEFIRMAAFNLCQRSTVAVNHGLYYVDVTASTTTQDNFKNSFPPLPPRPVKRNIFLGGKTYDFFHVYAKPATEQTFKMYVGPGFNPMTDVKLIRVKFPSAPFKITPGTDCAHSSPTLKCEYDGNSILTVTLNHSAFAGAYASAAQEHCVQQ
jgi:hypothetical protein